MPIDAVVFDIGRVLIEWNPERLYESRLGAERARALFAEVPLATMNEGVDLGAPFRQSVEALARAHPEQADAIMLWHDCWLDMATPAIDGSVRLLRALRARGIPVYALSNFGAETFEIAAAHYPFFAEFDRRFVSAHLRLIKPDPAIYALVETETGHPPERLLFTDDKPENIAAAAARGWLTHLFEGPDGLARRLVSEGLLTTAEAA